MTLRLIFYLFHQSDQWSTYFYKKSGKKYFLDTFWQKLMERSILMQFLPYKTLFCQKLPRKVSSTESFFLITERTCSDLLSVKNLSKKGVRSLFGRWQKENIRMLFLNGWIFFCQKVPRHDAPAYILLIPSERPMVNIFL